MGAYGFLMNPSLSQEKMIKNPFVSHLKTSLVQNFMQIPLGDFLKNFKYH